MNRISASSCSSENSRPKPGIELPGSPLRIVALEVLRTRRLAARGAAESDLSRREVSRGRVQIACTGPIAASVTTVTGRTGLREDLRASIDLGLSAPPAALGRSSRSTLSASETGRSCSWSAAASPPLHRSNAAAAKPQTLRFTNAHDRVRVLRQRHQTRSRAGRPRPLLRVGVKNRAWVPLRSRESPKPVVAQPSLSQPNV